MGVVRHTSKEIPFLEIQKTVSLHLFENLVDAMDTDRRGYVNRIKTSRSSFYTAAFHGELT